MRDLGDRQFGSIIDFKFTTVAPATGLPTTLAGTPVISVYPANSTTEITAGVTLTPDADSRTGMNHVRIDLSGSASYARRQDYDVVITTGTVGGTSAVGYIVATFSIENRHVAGLRTRGICPSSGSHTTTAVVLPTAISFPDGALVGDVLSIVDGTNEGRKSNITGWNNTTKLATIDPALAAACDNTSEFELFLGAVAGAAQAQLLAATVAEETGVPAANAPVWQKINFMFAKARNKLTQTATTQTLRNDADAGNIATSTVSDDGTTFTRGEFS